MKYIRDVWSQSKIFRIILSVTLLYTALRLTVHGVYVAMLLFPESPESSELPDWVEQEGPMIPNDLQDYLNGASALHNRQDLYLKGKLDKVEFFQYAPSYALAFVPFLWLPPVPLVIFHTLLHIAAYGALYVLWQRIFEQMKMPKANRVLAWTLPVWLVFSAFWGDLGYLNIYVIVALWGTLFIQAVLNEQLGWATLWLAIILQTKPQWAFAAVVPLLLGRYRFFIKLLVLAVISYVIIGGVTLLIIGPAYGWQQYVDYVRFLREMPGNFPWRGPDAPFLGYNHSVKQSILYLVGVSKNTLLLATLVKILLLVPLGIVSLRHLFHPVKQPGYEVPRLSLDFAFAFYLGAFIWLDMVWELSLGIAVFSYLLATLKGRNLKALVWVVFLPYALVDLWQLVSYAAFGDRVLLPGLYIATDPSIYVPLILFVILTFYGLLIKRLYQAIPV